MGNNASDKNKGGMPRMKKSTNRTELEGRGDYTETVRPVMRTARVRGNRSQQHRPKRVAVRLAHQPRDFIRRVVPGNRRVGGTGKRISRVEVGGGRRPQARRGHWRHTRPQVPLKNTAITTGMM